MSMKWMLRNMLYIGKVNYKGKQIFQGQHEAIISEDVFNKVQQILSENRREIKNKPQKNIGLLSQLIRCKHCDSAMIYSYSTKNKKWKYFYYYCLNAQKRGYENCPTKTINAQRLESQIVICLRQICNDRNILPGTWENLPFAQQREIMISSIKIILFEAETKTVFIMLRGSEQVHEFKIDLETSLIRAIPKAVALEKEPKLRQFLILAYQVQGLLDQDKAKSPKQVAEWLNMTPTKMYVLMNMTLLAPSIQEEIIFSNNNLIQLIPEYKMNQITREISWHKQKQMWQVLTAGFAKHTT